MKCDLLREGGKAYYLHQFSNNIPSHNMIKYGLQPRVAHQTELDLVPVPRDDGAVYKCGDCHLKQSIFQLIVLSRIVFEYLSWLNKVLREILWKRGK